MKRRRFLQMIGASVTAPFVPAPAFATSGKAAIYSPAAVHAAIYHAQTRAVFSVWGLAKATNMTAEQATAVMEHLAKRGILGPLQGTTHGGRWASSQILQSEMLAKARALRAARAVASRDAGRKEKSFSVDLTRFLAHVRTIAARYESCQTGCAVP